MVRVFDDGRYRARGVAHYTDSGITVGKDPTDHGYILRESHWAVRPDSTGTPSQPPSPFEPSKTPQTFLRRLIMSPMFLTAGEELHWPSSMTSEEGTMLTLGFDGSLLVRMPTGTASCPGGRGVRNQSEDGRFVLVTLVDADFEKFMRAQESSKKRSKKKGVVYEMKAVLRFTETGGVVSELAMIERVLSYECVSFEAMNEYSLKPTNLGIFRASILSHNVTPS